MKCKLCQIDKELPDVNSRIERVVVMFSMSKNAEAIILKKTGLTPAEISRMSADEEAAFIEKKIGKPLEYSTTIDYRKMGRGNPLLARKRYRTMDYVNSEIDRLCK